MHARHALLAILAILFASRAGLAASVAYLGADERSGSSQAVVVEGQALAHTGQLLPLDKQGDLIGGSAVDAQLAQVIFNLEAALAAAGSGSGHLVKLNVYVDSPRTADAVRKLFAQRFRKPVLPAMSWVCTPLPHAKALVALDAVAIVPGEAPTAVTRKRCEALAGDAHAADVAILPPGHAVYLSAMAGNGELAVATAKAITGLMYTMDRLGLDPSHVVQLKAFVKSLREADVVKQQISKVFAAEPMPPLVFVEQAADTPIAIEMIAFAPAAKLAPPSSDTVSYLAPSGAPPTAPLCSPATCAQSEKRIYISGLYAEKSGDAEAQARNVYATLERIAKQAGSDLRHLVKATSYVSDADSGSMLRKLQAESYNPQRLPAASAVMVKGVGMSGRSITLDAIAVPPPK